MHLAMMTPCMRLGASTSACYAPSPICGARRVQVSCRARCSCCSPVRIAIRRQLLTPCKAAGEAFSPSSGDSASQEPGATDSFDTAALPENFCLIESRDSVKDFAALNIEEVELSIEARRNKIFLLMEEVRRLRIQRTIKARNRALDLDVDVADEKYPSALPFLPPLSDKTLRTYYTVYAAIVGTIVIFGGLLAPVAEVRLGIGGTSYADFIQGAHLPGQLAQVDPIVASFCGGAVGVLSALLVVEVNNATAQAKRRCIYCEGMGYLMCGNCLGSGSTPPGKCSYCSGTGKVMCTSCLCTGKQMATEHDRRLDPFD